MTRRIVYLWFGVLTVGSFLAVFTGCEPGSTEKPASSTTTPAKPVVDPIAQLPPIESLPPEKQEFERKRRAWAKVALRDPSKAALHAPGRYKAKFETTGGVFVIEGLREYAPNSNDRFYSLCLMGFYDGARFYRVTPGDIAEFGVHADPAITKAWEGVSFDRDTRTGSHNTRGTVSFAIEADHRPVTRVFINYGPNLRKNRVFTPFGRVVQGMDVVDDLLAEYDLGPPNGEGPDRERIAAEGNAYLDANFPAMDAIKRVTIIEQSREPEFPDWVQN